MPTEKQLDAVLESEVEFKTNDYKKPVKILPIYSPERQAKIAAAFAKHIVENFFADPFDENHNRIVEVSSNRVYTFETAYDQFIIQYSE